MRAAFNGAPGRLHRGGAVCPGIWLKVFRCFLPGIIVADFNLPFSILNFLRALSLSNSSLYPAELAPCAFYSRGVQATVAKSVMIILHTPTKLLELRIVNHITRRGQVT